MVDFSPNMFGVFAVKTATLLVQDTLIQYEGNRWALWKIYLYLIYLAGLGDLHAKQINFTFQKLICLERLPKWKSDWKSSGSENEWVWNKKLLNHSERVNGRKGKYKNKIYNSLTIKRSQVVTKRTSQRLILKRRKCKHYFSYSTKAKITIKGSGHYW